MRREYFKAMSAIILTAIIGGGLPVFTKIALKEIPPFSFTLLRFSLAFLTILPILAFKKDLKITKDFVKIFFISLFAVANVTFFALGVRLTTATTAQILYAAVPLIVAIFSFLLLKEKLSLPKIIGVIIGFLGIGAIIILPILGSSWLQIGNFGGNIIIFMAVISFSIYTVLSKPLQKKYSPLYITAVFAFTCIISQSVLSVPEVAFGIHWWESLSFGAIASLLYVSIGGTIIYYTLYQYAIKHGSPLIASMTMYLQPVATYIWANIVLQEKISSEFIVGAILAFIGVWLTTRK